MPRHMNIKLTLIVLTMVCVSAGRAAAQTAEISKPIIVSAGNNEDSKAALALLAQTLKGDEIVILISRLGTAESLSRLNQRRLQVVRSHLDVTRATPIPHDHIVTAVGDSVRGQGRIEVYLRSKLFMIFTFSRNQNFAPEP